MTFAVALLATFAHEKPLMRDFIGLNTHTVQFRPDLYAPVTRRLRDYHPVEWDLGAKVTNSLKLPMAQNGVDWAALYGGWRKAGYSIDASLMFETLEPAAWSGHNAEARIYGRAVAATLGSSGAGLIESAEIGNEPSKFSDSEYRTVFRSMAEGLREGDPKLKIATCAVALGKKDIYSKDVANLVGLEKLYDVLNVHTYAFAEQWPTWRRSFPEDPSIPYLKQVQAVIDWRDGNAKGKQVWVTEFGYDASTKKPATTGDFSKWVGVSDDEQARYIVRSYLELSAMDVDRAYLYWFNDNDTPQLHGASGLTRDYRPKPAFHAVAQLFRVLGDSAFGSVAFASEGVKAFEFRSKQSRTWVIWSATGTMTARRILLPVQFRDVLGSERFALRSGTPADVTVKHSSGDRVEVEVDGSPIYLRLRR